MTVKLAGLVALCGVATAAAAATIPAKYVDGQSQDYKDAISRSNDGPVFHHLPYKTTVSLNQLDQTKMAWDVSPTVEVPNCSMMPEAKAALVKVLAEVNAKPLADGRKLFVTSCFRSIKRQVGVFCSPPTKKSSSCRSPALRAVTSAPSGYSEHATGYTLDFTTCTVDSNNKPQSPCGDLTEDAFKKTSAFQWLPDIARKNGFEMSFPFDSDDNLGTDWDGKPVHLTKQGVAYEPWHWRWVGTAADDPAKVAAARAVFARARKCFPLQSGIPVDPNEAALMSTINCPS